LPAAARVARGQVGPAEIGAAALKDPHVLRLSKIIALIDEPGYSNRFPAERWADATIVLKSGERLVSQPAVARGSAENPLSDAEVSDKYHMLMRAAGFGAKAAAIEDLVMSLDTLADASTLVDQVMAP